MVITLWTKNFLTKDILSSVMTMVRLLFIVKCDGNDNTVAWLLHIGNTDGETTMSFYGLSSPVTIIIQFGNE